MSSKAFIQKFLLFPFAAFLIWQSIQLIHDISQSTEGTSLGNVVVRSILLNVFITGIFLVGYALPLYRLLPASYYTSVESKLLARSCAFLQIELFRKILRLTFWTPRNNKKHFFNGKRNGFNQFEAKQPHGGCRGFGSCTGDSRLSGRRTKRPKSSATTMARQY